MKSIKSKAFVLALGLFAFSGAFAQDTPNTPKPDTTKAPKPDTTKSALQNTSFMMDSNSAKKANATFVSSSLAMLNDKKFAAKKEAIDDIKIS